MAEYLKNNFYKTAAVVSNILLSEKYGFSQGFDDFEQLPMRIRNDFTSQIVTENAVDYISENRSNKFFLWLHYMDPHATYIHHSEFGYSSKYPFSLAKFKARPDYLNKKADSIDNETLQYIKALYDEEISYTDKYIGRLIDYIEEIGLSDNTIIILTSDHGEEFKERNMFGHGKSLYQELIRVPLIIYYPRDLKHEPKRVKSNVEVRHIMKTVLDICGIGISKLGGSNLIISAEEDNQTEYSYSEVEYYSEERLDYKAIIAYDFKLISKLNNEIYELFDLKADSEEKVNLIDSEQEDIITIKKALLSKLSEQKQQIAEEFETVKLSKDEIEVLKALGYIQ